MYCIRKVNDDYTWVGADCRRLALFEGVFGVPDGVSFNSYLLMDDKTVLFDTVDSAVRTTFRRYGAQVDFGYLRRLCPSWRRFVFREGCLQG